jgi:hypothetical protein
MPAALLQAGLNLLLFLLSLAVVTGVGALVLRIFRIPRFPLDERVYFSFAAGLGATGYFVFVPAALGLLHPSLLGTVAMLLVVASAGGLRSFDRTEREMTSPLSPPSRGVVESCALLLLAGCLALSLILSLAPETGKDALIYHLAVPKQYLKAGGFRFLPGNIFSNAPLHPEMLYLLALFLRGEVLAKLLHFGAFGGVLLGMWNFSRRHLPGNAFPFTGLLLFAAIPTVFAVSHTSYTDLFVVLYTLAATHAFLNWSEKGEAGWLALSGCLCGLAVSTKYTALLLPFLGVLGVLWGSRRRGDTDRQAMRNVALYAVPFVLVGLPFYLKNLVLTGNPFYPFLYGLFGGKGWEPGQAQLYDAFVEHLGMGRGWLDHLLLPWNLSMRAEMDSPRFDGILGPVFLLTLPFLALVRRPTVPLKFTLVFSLSWFLFWASSAQQMRYLMPVFPFLALAVAAVLSFGRARSPLAFGVLVAFVAGGLAFDGYHAVRQFRKIRPLAVIAGVETRDEYLARVVPISTMYRHANLHLPPRSKVFLVYMRNYTYLCEMECYSDSMFESYTIQEILSSSGSSLDVARALRAKGFTHLMYDSRFVFGEISQFQPEEMDRFRRFQEERLAPVHEEGNLRLYRIDGA